MEICRVRPGRRVESHSGLIATVLRHSPGYTQVRVERGTEHVVMPDGREFDAHKTYKTEWSRGTLVRVLEEPVPKKMIPHPATAKTKTTPDSAKPKPIKPAGKGAKVVDLRPESEKRLSAVVAEPAPVTNKLCKCGCGLSVTRTFKPGHDARYWGVLKAVASGKRQFNTLNRSVYGEFKTEDQVKSAVKEHYQ